MAALFALGLFFAPFAAQQAPGAALYATNFGEPNPVTPGETITWTLQGLNTGTTTLEAIGWTSEQCGSASYPGPFAPGTSTPLVTCTSTAPGTGTADNATHFTAADVDSGDVLTQDVTAHVTVATASPTTTPPPTPTTGRSGIDIGDAVRESLGAESSRRSLPDTGADATPLAAGLGVAALGALLLVTSRTRRR